jgi:hypothetical protein
MEKYKNVLLNILNVIVRISDKDFINSYWGRKEGYNSIITDCREAIEILDDYFFFDLTTESKGYWEEISFFLSEITVYNLILLAEKINSFTNYDKDIDQLIIDSEWLDIMELAKKAAVSLKKDIRIENDTSYLL